MQIKNFGAKVNGVYYLKKGVCAAVTYSEEEKRISYMHTSGDYLGIDKFFFGVGIVDYYIFGDSQYELISDENFLTMFSDEKFSSEFSEYLKIYYTELFSLSAGNDEKIIVHHLNKLASKANNTTIKGIPEEFVKTLMIKGTFDRLVKNSKVNLEKGMYIIKK